jgi:putative ABC transport system ATP-binding protein
MGIVQLDNVKKTYPLGKVEVEALRGVTLEITKGDFISIAGPSGSGKTTLLNLIGCIDTPTAGTVKIHGRTTSELSDRQITRVRRDVLGFIFQFFNLLPVLDVYENIEFPLLLRKQIPNRRERREWINHLIEAVGLTKWKSHRPNELSGGQRQRVAIARALVTRPEIVLADEPTGNLDSRTGEQIIELMKRSNREFDTTFIFSTHDPTIVSIADHVVHLGDGLITSEERRRAESDPSEGTFVEMRAAT